MKVTQGTEIYQKLKQDIILLRLKPEQQLSIKDLATSFGVSRSPIRDALLKLSNERLVEIIPQSGCKVTLINMDMAEQERFIRKSVELEMIKRKSLNITKDFITKQKSNLELQKNALEESDLEKFFMLDEEFHKRLFEASNLEFTWNIIENNTYSSYQRIRVLSMQVKDITDATLKQHEKILEAIVQKDFSKLLEFEDKHISKISDEIPLLQSQFPTYFTRF
jgi:DNA-binding GntR family transcriptional regulator